MKKITAALLALFLSAQLAHAASTVNPTVPAPNSPMASAPIRSNFQATFNDINNLLTKFGSATAPIGPSVRQDWVDTTGTPWVWNVWDGAQWVSIGTINATTHVFTPASGGPPGGAAGGDLAGTYPNPTVTQVNGTRATSTLVAGPASATSGDVPTYNGTGGKTIQDSGKAAPSGAFVGTTDTQTLSSKTIASPILTGTVTTPLTGGGTQCTQVNNTGDLSGTGSGCGSFSAALGTVTAAGTTNLGASANVFQTVSGNTTITSFGTSANTYRVIRFTGTPLLTNSSVLVSPTGANIQACPGDVATLSSDNTGTPIWTIATYTPFGATTTNSVLAAGVASTPTNITSVTLPGCGKWILTGTAQENGLTAASNDYFTMAIGATSASYTGTVSGKSKVTGTNALVGAGTPVGSASIGPLDVTVTTSTPYYLIANTRTTSDAFDGYMRAVRSY